MIRELFTYQPTARYNFRMRKDTLRTGLLMSIVGCISCLLFYILDSNENYPGSTLIWRLIGFSGSAIFLFIYFFRVQWKTTQFYALALSCYLVMMTGLAVDVTTSAIPTGIELRTSITIGLTTSWIIVAAIAAGARKHMLLAGLVILSYYDYAILSDFFQKAPAARDFSVIRLLVTVNMSALVSFGLMLVLEKQYRSRITAVLQMRENEQRLIEKSHALEAANKNLLTFSQGISHDLKGPLSQATSFFELYHSKLDAGKKEEAHVFLNQVESCVYKSNQVAKDLLQYAQLSNERLRLEHVNALFVIYKVLNELDLNNQSKISFIKKTPADLFADKTLLGHLLTNLISNAVKFSSKQSDPVIEIETRAEGNYTILSVRDNGVGFPSEKADKLGTAFTRYHLKSDFEGTGLGLALVRQIISLHKGKFKAEGSINEGATFYCYFPNKPT